ncbi:LysM peptidoglycan-binding domain-containing protein [Granulicella cerasi]|uniref:LysM peptidoglycan-binding domain-containing protein n=1 Tax=Granulicella cerasi TaxID=741063 RepID=A0ABW1Z936_9BACT
MGKTKFLTALAVAPLCAVLTGCPADNAAQAGAPSSIPAYGKAPTTVAAPAQPSPAQSQSEANQRAAKVGSIIARAQASYTSGVQNYNNNRLDAARQDFDYAVDTMLSSGIDIKSDPTLNEAFERLLSDINSLEMVALAQGNGFSQPIEDAPLAGATEMTFAPNPELVAKLKGELNTTSDLPLVINDQVAGYINVFSQSNSFRAHMSASMQRLGKYRTLIQNVLREEGVPQDLIYLAVAESGFQPQAMNAKSGAGGMWQFMSYTGPEYGLIRNGYFDYRFDPEKSTRAYAKHIKKYYSLFNDWYLAMISYDWGPGNVQRIVSRTGYSDFWDLYRHASMPAETRAYVPQILAAIIMAKNPEKYGLNKLPPSPPVIYDTVHTDYAIDLRLVADLTGSTVADLVALNPAMLRLTTAPDMGFDLHIPPGTTEVFNDRLKDIPEDKRTSWRFHVVRPGETLDGIAETMHAKADEIAELNDVTAAKPLQTDDELIIPMTVAASAPRGVQRYTARRGDTLVSIADRFGVTVDDLRTWNHLSSSSVSSGKTLYVAEPVRLGPSGRSARGRRASRSHGRASASSSRGSSHSSKSAKAHGSSSKASSAKASTKSASHSAKKKHR